MTDIPQGMPADTKLNSPFQRQLLAQGDRGMSRHLLNQALTQDDPHTASVYVHAAEVFLAIATAEETIQDH